MGASVSRSVRDVPQSRIREIANIAFGMNDVLRLYFGEASEPTPEYIRNAAVKALAEGHTYYTSNAGTGSLREALSEYYARMHNVRLDPAREIVVTASGVQALHVALRCVLDPGDEGLVLTPAWPNGASIIALSGGRAVEVPQPLADGRYGIDWQGLEKAVTARTRLLLYTSPSNPLGWVATAEDQRRLLDFTRRHGLWLVADEVYERLWFATDSGKPVPSILQMADRNDAVVVVQSFSKSYCMTGWRLGWLVGRTDLAEKTSQMNEFIISCANGVAQRAGEAALSQGDAEIRLLLARFKANRDFCLAALRDMPGVTVPEPDGAFYVFPHIKGLGDSFEFCRRLLLETRVGIAPGVAFGTGGEGSVRICYAAERNILEPAMDRLRQFLIKFSGSKQWLTVD